MAPCALLWHFHTFPPSTLSLRKKKIDDVGWILSGWWQKWILNSLNTSTSPPSWPSQREIPSHILFVFPHTQISSIYVWHILVSSLTHVGWFKLSFTLFITSPNTTQDNLRKVNAVEHGWNVVMSYSTEKFTDLPNRKYESRQLVELNQLQIMKNVLFMFTFHPIDFQIWCLLVFYSMSPKLWMLLSSNDLQPRKEYRRI